MLRFVNSAATSSRGWIPPVRYCWALGLLLLTSSLSAQTPADIAFFETKVRPLLVKRCFECHSTAGEHEADLFLDSRAGWSEGGQSGPAIVPGKPAESLLMKAVRYEDLEMPPSGKLPAAEIAILDEWIARGAPDPRVGPDAPRPRKGIDIAKGRSHWAFQLPQRHPVPQVAGAAWPRTDVDRFLLAAMEQQGLAPSPDADRYALLRRATFDLHGLPPTVAEIDAFIADRSPGAFAKVVDRLLASERFGERWARHWFDVARFAEADGHFFAEAWRYRDYVIEAFNADMPFDQFVGEQLAGDLLPSRSPEERDRRLIATGFLALGPNYFPKTENQNYMDIIDEQIDATTRSLLALTVSCARCHDHKFDPIPTTDYYALAGILTSTEICKTAGYAKGKHTFLGVTHGQPLAGYQQAPVERWSELVERSYLDGHAVVHMGWKINELKRDLAKADGATKQAIEKQIDALNADMAARNQAGPAARVALRALPKLPPMAMSVKDRPQPADAKVRIRGEEEHLGPEVPRGVIQVATVGAAPVIGPAESGRRQLAEWIGSRHNPLTARVAVNRIWLHLFGEGLVRTVDDFGTMGERPTHAELLDDLAVRFMDDGWSTKRLIRELLLSHAYQVSVRRSEAGDARDADNRLLWRRHLRRLESEAIRDALLAFSGELDLQPLTGSLIGDHGPGTLRFDAEILDFESTKRSIYLPQPRGRLPSLYKLFDHVDMALVTGRRDVTTVPLQALFLLNSDFARARATQAADRLIRAQSNPTRRIDLAFRLAYGRPPTSAEGAIARSLLQDFAHATPSVAERHAWVAFCQVLMASPEFVYVH